MINLKLNSLSKIIDGDTKDLINSTLRIAFLVIAIGVLISPVIILANWPSIKNTLQSQCWELQNIENKFYSVNKCTGKVIMLEYPNK